MIRKTAHTDMIHTLEEHQQEMLFKWIGDSLPEDWNGMDTWHPVRRHKTRVTLRLDSDMVRWFRKLGPGYGQRVNDVLRVYFTALHAGHIRAHYDDDVTPRLRSEARRLMDQVHRERDALE